MYYLDTRPEPSPPGRFSTFFMIYIPDFINSKITYSSVITFYIDQG